MKVEKFEKQLKGLGQVDILTGAVDSLNKLLVDKGVITQRELQDYFSSWINKNKRRVKRG